MKLYDAPSGNWKFFDHSSAGFEFNNNSTSSVLLNAIDGSDTVYGRGGQRVQYKSIELRGHLYCAPPLALPTNYSWDTISFALVYDSQPNGALATWSNVFFSTDSVADSTSPANFATKQRFLVLKRWIVPTNRFIAQAAGTITNIGAENINLPNEAYQFYKKINLDLSTTWASTTGSIANIQTGAILLVGRSTNFATGASPWYLKYSTRLTYTDTVPGL